MMYIDQLFLKGSLIQSACIHLFWWFSTDHCILYCVNTSLVGENIYNFKMLNSNSWLRDFEILREDAPRMRSQYVPAIGVSLTY